MYRERAEAASSLRQSRAEAMQVSVPQALSPEGSAARALALAPQSSSLSLAAGIDDLVAALKTRRGIVDGGASEDGSASASGLAQLDCVDFMESCLNMSLLEQRTAMLSAMMPCSGLASSSFGPVGQATCIA